MDNKLLNYAILIFTAVATFFFIAIDPTKFKPEDVGQLHGLNQELFFRYGVMCLFGLTFFARKLRELTAPVIGVFLIYVLINALNGGFAMEFRRAVLNIFLGLLFYKIIYEHLDHSMSRAVGWMAVTVVSVNVLFCALQYFHLDPMYTHIHPDVIPWPEPTGLVNLESHLGTLAVMLNPLMFILSPWLTLLALPLVYFSKSSASAVAYLVTTIFILHLRLPKWCFRLLVGLVISAGISYVFFYDLPSGNFGARLPIWHMTLSKVLKQSTFFGFGPGSFGMWAPTVLQPDGHPQTWIWAHNEYIQLMFETGLVGLGILFIYISGIFKRFFWTINKACYAFTAFLGLMLVSFFHFPFHLARLAVPAVFVMAFCHLKLEQT